MTVFEWITSCGFAMISLNIYARFNGASSTTAASGMVSHSIWMVEDFLLHQDTIICKQIHLRSKTRFFAQFHIIFGVNQINEKNIDVSVRMFSSMPTDRHLFKYFPISKDFLWWCTLEFLSSAPLFNIAKRYAVNSCLVSIRSAWMHICTLKLKKRFIET